MREIWRRLALLLLSEAATDIVGDDDDDHGDRVEDCGQPCEIWAGYLCSPGQSRTD